MALSDIVNVTVSLSGANLTLPGFGIPLIVACLKDIPGGFTNRVRAYSDANSLAVDFPVTTATYKQAAQILAQNPRPSQVKIGRSTVNPTQQWDITPTVTDNTLYEVTVDGVVADFT